MALTSVAPALARAFTLNLASGTLEGWESLPIELDYNFQDCPAAISSDTLHAVLDQALGLWNGAPSSRVSLRQGSPVTLTITDASSFKSSGHPLILCDPNFSSDTGGVDPDFVPALTLNQRVDPTTNRIIFSTILLNAQAGKKANISSVDTTTLAIVLAHEIGHLLGLGHASDPRALMYYDLSAKTRLALGEDDLSGISYLYPRREFLNSLPMGCGIFQRASEDTKHTKDPHRDPEWILFGIGFLMIWTLLRRPSAQS